MCFRLQVFLVAFVLFWSGGFLQQPAADDRASPAPPSDAWTVDDPSHPAIPAATDGSSPDGLAAIELLSQAHAESAADGPGLPVEKPFSALPALKSASPRAPASGALRPPYLDGPRRPPRATPFVA